MLAQVTTLHHWKSEHTAETCEDAVGADRAHGLFVVADGAGTTLFSDAWARFLVRHFLSIPLLDADPFEVEWWMRLAQEQFKQESPERADLAWNAQQKMQDQGSYATLAALRISEQNAGRARAELLAIGDSCIFIQQAGHTLSFPLQREEEFEQAPICLPSKPGAFHRYFQRFQSRTCELGPDDLVVLATDAVAKWIISAGNGRHSSFGAALQEVASQTVESWPTFLATCRAQHAMLDDDSTALVITLQADGTIPDVELGATTEHSQPVRLQRKQNFQQAVEDQHKERIAIYYGNGLDLEAEGITMPTQAIAQAREVADALREVLSLLRQAVNRPDVVPLMTEAWQRQARLLYAEPCAAPVRATLARLGVPIEPQAEGATMEAPEPPPLPEYEDPQQVAEDDSLLLTRTFEVSPTLIPRQEEQQKMEER